MNEIRSQSEWNLSVILWNLALSDLASEEILVNIRKSPVPKNFFVLQSKTEFWICEGKLAASLAKNERV